MTPKQMTTILFGYPISILIDTGATKCFVDPKIIAKIPIRVGFMAKLSTIKFDNKAKHRVEKLLFCSELELPSF